MDPLALANLAIAMANSGRKVPPSSEHQAVVLRADRSGTYWVRIPGGADETPVRTSYVNAMPGDVVSVTIAGGSATMRGNATSPSATGRAVSQVSQTANMALQSAVDAGIAADSAIASATLAAEAAEDAQASADEAADAAERASEDARTANRMANGAIAGLGTVEAVTGTIDWIANHRAATTDTTVVSGKSYYTYDESTGTLSKVEPVGTENPSQEGWYELDEAISNYVASHVATTDDGLYVAGLENGWRVLVSTGEGGYPAGIFLIDDAGVTVQSSAADGIGFDSERRFRIGDDDAYIEFDGNGNITIGGVGVTISGGVTINSDTKIDGSSIVTGSIDAELVNVTNINADNITSGQLSAEHIDASSLSISSSQVDGLQSKLEGYDETFENMEKESQLRNQWVQVDATGVEVGRADESGSKTATVVRAGQVDFVVNNDSIATVGVDGFEATHMSTPAIDIGADWSITVSDGMLSIEYIGS